MVDPEESNVASELKERIDNWKFREPDAYYAYGRGGTISGRSCRMQKTLHQ